MQKLHYEDDRALERCIFELSIFLDGSYFTLILIQMARASRKIYTKNMIHTAISSKKDAVVLQPNTQ